MDDQAVMYVADTGPPSRRPADPMNLHKQAHPARHPAAWGPNTTNNEKLKRTVTEVIKIWLKAELIYADHRKDYYNHYERGGIATNRRCPHWAAP